MPKAIHNRVIIVKADGETLRIPYTKQMKLDDFRNKTVLVTGDYNACAGTLRVVNSMGVEMY